MKSIAVASAAAALPKFSAAEVGKKSQLKVGLVGCSGRGIGAVSDMLTAAKGAVKIVAIADLFADRNDRAIKIFEKYAKKFGKDAIDVPESRRFAGWDAYKQILGEDIDIIIHATPPVFRPLHIREFVNAGKHLFVEKPACVDPVQCREMLEIADLADKKNLTIIPGIQRRFHPGYQEAIKRLQDGQIGEIVGAQAYWLNSRFFIQDNGVLRLQNPDPEEMEYQIRNWFIFRWTSGDCYVEQHVHNLDVILWGLGKDPKEVCGVGGRRWDIEFPKYGDRFSHFGVDFDFGEGLHCASYSRRENKSSDIVCERFIGTKGVLETNLDGQPHAHTRPEAVEGGGRLSAGDGGRAQGFDRLRAQQQAAKSAARNGEVHEAGNRGQGKLLRGPQLQVRVDSQPLEAVVGSAGMEIRQEAGRPDSAPRRIPSGLGGGAACICGISPP